MGHLIAHLGVWTDRWACTLWHKRAWRLVGGATLHWVYRCQRCGLSHLRSTQY